MPSPTVFANARIGTASDVCAIVVDGPRIAAVVPMAEAPTGAHVDLDGRTVLPGIDDSHLHAYELGRSLTAIDCTAAASLQDLQSLLRGARPEATGWYRGHGWESTRIHGSGTDGRVTAADIDAATDAGPALLSDSTGHAALANSRALELAGIGPGTDDPEGGIVVRDDSGRPTGLLLEAAVSLVASAIPPISAQDRTDALLRMQEHLLARGIVAVTDPGLGPGGATLMDGTGTLEAVQAYQDLDASGRLALRTHVMLLFGGLGGTRASDVAAGLDAWGPPTRAAGARRLSIDQVKVFADGIPRSRTAWVSEPYDDCSHGSLTIAGATDAERVEEFRAIVAAAASRGWQVGAHCTGDATISAFLDAVEATATSHLRHYVIHGDLVQTDDLARLARLGMGMNTNPSIRWTVGTRVNSVLGTERNLRKQPLAQAIAAGIPVALSSDAPVVAPDWQLIMAAAMTRALSDDPSYRDANAITPAQAITGMTAAAAWQGHDESWRGAIAPGLAADLLVLDGEVDWDDAWTLRDRTAQAVLIDGTVVYGSLT